jgi:cysteine-rich repeat protein
VPGHFYATRYNVRDITEYDANGRLLGAITLPPEAANNLRGLAFGSDGLLYVVADRWPQGFAVLALDESGIPLATYRSDGTVANNANYGKIAIAGGDIYVGTNDGIAHFDRTRPGLGTVIYRGFGVFDIEILPTGNLFAAADYLIRELTPDGRVVRTLPDPRPQSYVNIRAIEYDRARNDLYVSQLGYTDFFDRVMRIDASSGGLEADFGFWRGADLFWTIGNTLLVSSGDDRYPARLFSSDLQQIGELAGASRTFVTQHPLSPTCGDATLDPLEQCDDGNRRSGDGCRANCVREPLRIGVQPTLLTIREVPFGPGHDSIRFSAEDPAITKGPAAGLDAIRSEITIAYGDGVSSGVYSLASGDEGWRTNDARRATFVSTGDPRQARRSTVETGKRLSFAANGLGDEPLTILAATDAEPSVATAHCTTNAGVETCLCSEFPRCRLRTVLGRGRLACRNGVADPTCRALRR